MKYQYIKFNNNTRICQQSYYLYHTELCVLDKVKEMEVTKTGITIYIPNSLAE